MSSLSSRPEKGSYLVQSMFSAVPLKCQGHVKTFQVINFAGVYDEMYGYDKDRVVEFEVFNSYHNLT